MFGVRRRRAPERHHRVADKLVDRSAMRADLARHGVEIAGQQRDDPVAEPLRQAGKAGDVGEQHRERPHRAPRSRLDAFAQQHLHQIRGYVFAKRGKAACHVGDGAGQIFKLCDPRRMTSHLVEFEALDMLEFADHGDQRGGDDAPGDRSRNDPGDNDETGESDEQIPDRALDRSQKLGFRNDGRKRPAWKVERRQSDGIGVAGGDITHWSGAFFAGVVGAAGLHQRAARDRQQHLIGPLHVDFVRVGIGRGDGRAVAAQDECGAGFADRKLGQKLREAGVLDDDRQHALALLIDIDRTGIDDRGTRSDRMGADFEPGGLVAFDAFPIPFLIGDEVRGILEPPLLELNVADHDLIIVDPAFDRAVDAARSPSFRGQDRQVCARQKNRRSASRTPPRKCSAATEAATEKRIRVCRPRASSARSARTASGSRCARHAPRR